MWGGIGLGTLAVAFALLFDLSRHAVSENSDSATVALEGQAMLHGNVLLNHWTISLDSFWSIDALFNAVFSGVLGLRAALVNVVPAVIAVLVVALGALVAVLDSTRSRASCAVPVVATMLLLPGHALSFFFLQGPWHIGTALWCLIAFLGLHEGRFNLGWVVAIVFLAAGLLGDVQMLALGVVPVFVAGLAAVGRSRRLRPGLSLLVASPAAVLLALVIREIALSLGTFTFKEAHHTAHLARMEHNLGHLAAWTLALLGVTPGPFGGPRVPVVVESAHAMLVVLVACAGLYALVLLARGLTSHGAPDAVHEARSRMDDLLLFAAVGDLGVFELLTLSNNVLYARYLTAGVVFATVLTARMVARVAERSWSPRLLGPLGVVVGAIVVALCTNVVIELRGPLPTRPAVALEHYLVEHHLSHGVGDYWAASIVTLDSGGAVTIRPVVANLHHLIVPDGRQADGSWYRGQRFQFLVFQTLPYGRVDVATVTRTFGMPVHVQRVGQYFVATWRHQLALSGAAFP